MPSIFSCNYLSRLPVDQAMQQFGQKFSSSEKVLDIGCGHKPYAQYFNCEYVGLDHSPDTSADIVADSSSIPLPDNSFDGLILNQTLEHTQNLTGTIHEIKRLLKKDGLCLISVPLAMKIHSLPLPIKESPVNNFDPSLLNYWNIDYWRFTKYGLIVLFHDFHISSIKETSGYVGTLAQMTNYFFASLGLGKLFSPLYFINNALGLWLDKSIAKICLHSKIPILKKFYDLIYSSFPLNYILIIKKS
jgi:SAM-dependent methyltransferase